MDDESRWEQNERISGVELREAWAKQAEANGGGRSGAHNMESEGLGQLTGRTERTLRLQ